MSWSETAHMMDNPGLGGYWWGMGYPGNMPAGYTGQPTEIMVDTVTTLGSKNTLQFNYPIYMTKGGHPPGKYWNVFSGQYGETNELYIEYYIKYSSNYEWHGVMNKQLYVDSGPTNVGSFYGVIIGATYGPGPVNYPTPGLMLGMQSDLQSTSRWQNLGRDIYFVGGRWYKCTVRLVMNTGGSSNGIIEMWIDELAGAGSVKVLSHNDIGYKNQSGGPWGFAEVDITPVYGGVSDGVKDRTDYQRYAELTFSNAPISGGGLVDGEAPTVPTNLSATAVSSSQINLAWTASTDNIGVAGYTIYRNGAYLNTTSSNNYSDINLTQSTQYTYTVLAYDAAGNSSVQSASTSATTQPGTTTSPGTVSDLSVAATSSTSLSITFTQVDDGSGLPAKYDVRVNTPTIDWGSASSVVSGTASTPLVGTGIGTQITRTITGLSVDTPYQVQMVAYRGTLNVSGVVFGGLSNVSGATTLSTGTPPTVSTTSLLTGSQKEPYTATLSAAGGTPPYTWTIVSGGLPSGLSLNSSTGVISGTPS
jgi:hypothetical protein